MSSIIETRQNLVGTWILVEYKVIHTETDHATHPLGPKAQGLLVYSADGFMSAQLMQPEAPAFSINDVQRGTQEELSEAMKHYLGYCGRYNIQETDEGIIVMHNVELCSFPNWVGTQQGRLVTLNGNNMELNTANSYFVNVSTIADSLFSHSS